MSSDSHKISHSSLMSIRNNLAHIYRFGGICSALKFNPSNISGEESKNISNHIINLLNEEMWERGVDLISTSYNNGGCGFMLVTTVENKEQIKKVLENLQISKSLKNEYVVLVNDILALSSSKRTQDFSSTSYLMTIYDNYKINTHNQFSLSLNEDSNVSSDYRISERSIMNIQSHLSKLGLESENDSTMMSMLGEISSTIANKSKDIVVPAAVVASLYYLGKYLVNKHYGTAKATVVDTFDESLEESLNFTAGYSPAEPAGPFEPSLPPGPAPAGPSPAGPKPPKPPKPFSPSEPFAPSAPFDTNLTFAVDNSDSSQRLSSLLKTLEDSDVKQTRVNNIESKILSLLAETTTSH